MTRPVGVLLLVFAFVPSTAVSAQGVQSPHGPLPDELDCSACHTAAGWSPLRRPLVFDHDARTGFTLSGAHARSACATCHLDLRFDGPDLSMDDCAGCHADVHQGKMVRDCADCHDPVSFHAVDGEAAHARTSFPLTGAHRQITCESCHLDDVGGPYTPLETECAACHADEYASALTVDHVANAYPIECAECHSSLGWHDAPAFDHAAISGGFELLGAHDGLRCASCHTLPNLDPIYHPSSQDDCVACHQSDHDRAHAGAGYFASCSECHSVSAWRPSTFDHESWFPIRSGAHQGASCSDCHSSPSDFSFFTCLTCHVHAQATMDEKHKETAGYAYESGACLTCHPRGNH